MINQDMFFIIHGETNYFIIRQKKEALNPTKSYLIYLGEL